MDINAPAPRNLAQEGADSLKSQVELAPEVYASKAQYDPLYTGLQVSNVRNALLGNGTQPGLVSTLEEVAPRFQAISDATQRNQRAADVAALRDLGPEAVAAIRAADPRQEALIGRLNTAATQGLDAGAGLDPSLANTISQSVRSRAAASGFGFGLPDAVTEAFTLGERGNQLRQQRQQFAQSVAGLNAGTGADPALAVLGRPSQAAAGAQGLLGMGSQNVGAAGAPDFNPFNAYASDLFNTNYNGNAAAEIASGNATAGIIGAGLSAL